MFQAQNRTIYGHREYMEGPKRSGIPGVHAQHYEELKGDEALKFELLKSEMLKIKGDTQDAVKLRRRLNIDPKLYDRFLNRLEEYGYLVAESSGLVGLI